MELLQGIEVAAYQLKVPIAFNSSIGAHYRHCLDHFQIVIVGLTSGAVEIDYDLRGRDGRLETDLAFARHQTSTLQTSFRNIDPALLDRAVTVRCRLDEATGDAPCAPSTNSRELIYAVSHATHHYALIRVLCGIMEITLPTGFGVSAATLKHQRDRARAV